MAQTQRLRDAVDGVIDPELVRRRTQEGWRLATLEWVQEVAGPVATQPVREEIPYGLQIAADCRFLEENPAERGTMLAMFEMIVQDIPISEIAVKLNQRGLRTRTHDEWTPSAVFNLLPRLIEVGQRTFSTQQWAEIRRGLMKRAG